MHSTLQDDYQVTLESFKGPLDLLLYLIRRAEVDIHDIPIAQITDQYLEFLHQIDHIDIDLAGEFLVMAATLIEIKSRTLMPAGKSAGPESGDSDGMTRDGDSGDPRSELIQQLLAYQRYRVCSELLNARRHEFEQRFPIAPRKVAATSADDADADNDGHQAIDLELDDLSSFDLYSIYERITSSIDFARLGEHVVEIDDTPVELHQEDLLDRLRRAEQWRLTLQECFEGKSAGQRIGLFLAMLELVRTRRILVDQDDISAAITLTLNDDPEGNSDELAGDEDGATSRQS